MARGPSSCGSLEFFCWLLSVYLLLLRFVVSLARAQLAFFARCMAACDFALLGLVNMLGICLERIQPASLVPQKTGNPCWKEAEEMPGRRGSAARPTVGDWHVDARSNASAVSTPTIVSPGTTVSSIFSKNSFNFRSEGLEEAEPVNDKPERKLLRVGGQGKVFAQGSEAVKVFDCGTLQDKIHCVYEYHFMMQQYEACQNVLQAKSMHLDGDTASLVMELCEGDLITWVTGTWSLYSFREREAAAVGCLKQMATGLKALHAVGVVHGDIKPDNILVKQFPTDLKKAAPPDTLKIGDFGSSFFVKHSHALTEARGTPFYMAPEMRAYEKTKAGEVPSAPLPGLASDMWSLGITFWSIVTGEMFDFEDLDSKNQWLATMTPATVRLLAGLLHQDPEKRLTASALLEHPDLVNHPLAL